MVLYFHSADWWHFDTAAVVQHWQTDGARSLGGTKTKQTNKTKGKKKIFSVWLLEGDQIMAAAGFYSADSAVSTNLNIQQSQGAWHSLLSPHGWVNRLLTRLQTCHNCTISVSHCLLSRLLGGSQTFILFHFLKFHLSLLNIPVLR